MSPGDWEDRQLFRRLEPFGSDLCLVQLSKKNMHLAPSNSFYGAEGETHKLHQGKVL